MSPIAQTNPWSLQNWSWRRKLLFAFGFMLLLTAFLTLARPQKAHAYFYGYFSGGYEEYGPYVLDEGALDYNINDFVGHMYFNIFLSGDWHRQTGSSYIVLTMLGYPPGTPRGVAQTEFGRWESTVRYNDSIGRISWNEYIGYCDNTYYQPTVGDIADYPGCGAEDSIVFRDAFNNVIYTIKHRCANPVGVRNPLPPPPPPPPSFAIIQGRVWQDNNGDGIWNNGEPFMQWPPNACGGGYVNFNVLVVDAFVGSSPPQYCNPLPYYAILTSTFSTNTGKNHGIGINPATLPPGWVVSSANPVSVYVVPGGVYDVWFGIKPPFSPSSTPVVTPVCSGSTSIFNVGWSGGTGSAGGFWVDVSTNPGFGSFYNKSVGTVYSTTGPAGFALFPSSSPPMPALVPGTRYYVRVWNGQHSPVASFVARDCTPPVPSCGNVTTVPAIPEPGQPFNLTVSFTLSPYAKAATNYSITLSIAGVTIPAPNPKFGMVPDRGTSGSVTFNGLTAATAGQYNGTFTVSGGFRLSCPFDGLSGHPPPIIVAAKPYVRVYSGDVLAGSGFGSSCAGASSGIIGYNTGSAQNGTSNYGGAGVQFAAQATNRITEFASAAMRIDASNGPEAGLTFANTTNPPWGGSFGAAACAADYYATLQQKSGVTAIASPSFTPGSGGDFKYSGNLSVNAATINTGVHQVVYVDGNVAINGDIVYGSSSSWSLANIPSLYLIVRGNIYVQGLVTQLDGVYVAQPRTDGTGGYIYTCSNGFQSEYASEGANHANYHAICAAKLTINGAFLANRVIFGRTTGTLNNAPKGTQSTPAIPEVSTSGNIAEVFNFSPELWLINTGVFPTSTSNYNSITSLPPIL